ncbi:hypothetical protein [Castellaniella sp. GW247-6E4]|uniref:helix-turn-helix domain-containing protein n=1 Tax=Castellaniella sp. GW247-6E4 TaxID=3140380 RepID=UPI0033153F9D
MLFDPKVLAWGSVTDACGRIEALRASGFDIRVLLSPEEVAAQASQRVEGVFTPVLLMGLGPQAHAAVGWLRARLPGACLVALARTASEDERLALLEVGVDWICRPDESANLVAAVLLALWRRHLGVASGTDPRVHRGWILRGYAWTLEGPCGGRVGLTAGERAVMAALFGTPGVPVRRAELNSALEDTPGRRSGAGRPRLAVVINRMRAKGRRAGLDIPVRAVRGHGYVFGPEPDGPVSP